MNSRTWCLSVSLFTLTTCLLGCEDKPAAETKTAAAEQADAPQAAPAPPQKTAEEKAAEEAAATAAAKQAEAEAEAQKAVEENPITECCRALGQKGFMEHSPEYMGASKVCGEALEAKEDLAKALPGITKALKGKPVPSECSK